MNLIIIVCSIILFIEIYNETHIKNYGTFIERIKYLFSFKTIFKTAKLTSLAFIIYLIYRNYFKGQIINNDFLYQQVFRIDINNIYLYITPVLFYTFFIIISNSVEILKQFSFEEYNPNPSRLNQLIAFLLFIIYRLIAFSFIYLLFCLIFYLFLYIDSEFNQANLSVFDWMSEEAHSNSNYNSGVYFSLILTGVVFFLFNNAFIKVNSVIYDFRSIQVSFFGYFFITIILCIGVFFGFFSIFNAYYNINITSISEWINEENTLGILPLRVASILILINLFGYIYNETLEKRIFPFLLLAFLPIRRVEDYGLSISIERRETLFFSQISFYIINIALAEYFLIIEYKNFYISLLNFAILFIQDDFKIINDYSLGMQAVLKKHFRKIHFFNLLMFISSIVILVIVKSYGILSIYSFLSLILIYLYLRNFNFINSRDYY